MLVYKKGCVCRFRTYFQLSVNSDRLSVISFHDYLLILVVLRIANKILPISSAFSNNSLKFSQSKSPLSFNKCNQYLVSKHSL